MEEKKELRLVKARLKIATELKVLAIDLKQKKKLNYFPRTVKVSNYLTQKFLINKFATKIIYLVGVIFFCIFFY